jgi:acetyl-CoA carboxylase biotin carboxyl carrier protein
LKFEELCALIELVSKKGIPLVEIEKEGFKIKIQGTFPQNVQIVQEGVSKNNPPAQVAVVEKKEEKTEEGLHIISSPMVGTFYRAPSPHSEPFVKVGDKVKKGQVLCIIEAMKLMNEIESDVDGEIVEIYAQNAQAVDFGAKLFGIKTF